jgi:hypothetical protein
MECFNIYTWIEIWITLIKMKSIVIATLLITLVFASLRGAERKER